VLYLRAFATPERATRVIQVLDTIPDVRHLMRHPTADGREEMITADLDASAVDPALEALLDAGLAATDVMVERTNPIGPAEQRGERWLAHREDAMVWAEVVEGARENARLPARYAQGGPDPADDRDRVRRRHRRHDRDRDASQRSGGRRHLRDDDPLGRLRGRVLAVGTATETLFGLGFLAINIASLVLGGTLALVVQRRLRRSPPSQIRPAPTPDAGSPE
jgi:hypothetical protein